MVRTTRSLRPFFADSVRVALSAWILSTDKILVFYGYTISFYDERCKVCRLLYRWAFLYPAA